MGQGGGNHIRYTEKIKHGRVGEEGVVWKEKNVGRDAWKLASLRLIKKMRGTRVRKQGVIIRVHTL